MNIALLLEMAAEGAADRVAIGSRDGGLSYGELLTGSRSVATWIVGGGAERVALLDYNSPAVPLLLFASAVADRPFAPLNYRLAPNQLVGLLERLAPAVVIATPDLLTLDPPAGTSITSRAELLAVAADGNTPMSGAANPDNVAVWLFTSGTTGTPKTALLRHRHLVSYVISTVEFLGADTDEAALISVPPYHIAAITAVLSSVYAGRRIVQLEAFDPLDWVRLARAEAVTHAMVVPTMLNRILDQIESDSEGLPNLRHLSYGGGRMPVRVVERALRLLPSVGFVNAYGLTETSSTISVLGPDDHRAAIASDDPVVRRRLGSVGQPLPTLELQVRDTNGVAVAPGEPGEIYVRGEQVAGEYLGSEGAAADGWFATRDSGHVDADGYLFVEGRIDDIIIRGGENIAPAEIEEVLLNHPAVAEVGVIGLPDDQWGEQIAAAVVLAEGQAVTEAQLQNWVRGRLRSSRTPARVSFLPSLPYTDSGKLLRRVLRAELATFAPGPPEFAPDRTDTDVRSEPRNGCP